MTHLPRPEGVGGRAATIGSSSHLNAENARLRAELAQRKREWDALKAAFVARTERQEDQDEDSAIVIGFAACALSGFIVGLLLGLML